MYCPEAMPNSAVGTKRLKITSRQGIARGPHILRDCPGGLRINEEWFNICMVHRSRSLIQEPSYTLGTLRCADYVFLRPLAGDPKPFRIAKVAAMEVIPGGIAAVRLCYWRHDEENVKDANPFTGCYEPSHAHFRKPLSELPVMAVHASAIQSKVAMIKSRPGFGGGYRMQLSVKGLAMVQQWVEQNTSSLQELSAKREREDPKMKSKKSSE